MARIRSGILGNIRGKVAGVVGGQWKDVNYLREYVKPANPQTVLQTAQRSKMSDCVAFAKTLVGPVFNSYTDKFQKSMSGFNRFIKDNIVEFDGSLDASKIVLVTGVLYPLQSVNVTYAEDTEIVNFTWDEAIGNNGSLTDAVYGAIYDFASELWYFPAAEVTRDDEAMSVAVPDDVDAASLKSYCWAIRKSGTIVQALSNSTYFQVVNP